MLVLTRKKNEVVQLGEEITVHVIDVRGDKVRLGFEAPRDINIMRQELLKFSERSNNEFTRARMQRLREINVELKTKVENLQRKQPTEFFEKLLMESQSNSVMDASEIEYIATGAARVVPTSGTTE